MAIFTHGVEKLLYELNFDNNNKFCNVFFKFCWLTKSLSLVIVIYKTFKFEKRL